MNKFDFIYNIKSCFDFVNNDAPLRFIYSLELPLIFISLLLGIFVFYRNREEISSKIFSLICLCFSLWVFFDFITWTSYNSMAYMFVWSFFGILTSLIYILSVHFSYSIIFGKRSPVWFKAISFILLFPIVVLTPTIFNLSNFYSPDCIATEGSIFTNYYYVIGVISFIAVLLISLIKLRKTEDKISRKKILIYTLGIELFILFFNVANLVSSYLVNIGVTGDFTLEPYGLIGMLIFLIMIAFMMVRFKTFNIKLIGTQALVWALIIFNGSQFLFTQNIVNQILTAISLAFSAVLGLMIVRGVKKEVFLNEKLELANAGQTNLIHIINHQIKGYLGVTKNIFAELLTDDYGKVPEEAIPLVQKGLDQSDAGVRYVTEILTGDSAKNGTLVYDMKPINFKDLVTDVISKKKETAEKKGLKLNLNIIDGNYNTNADYGHLFEAIRNVIDNSIYYTPTGSISVNLQNKFSNILLSVKDTGVGIKDSDRPKLFTAGGSGENSRKINVQSSGYGLIFSKGVIEAHKGKIWFESAGEGKGTTFFVELPMK